MGMGIVVVEVCDSNLLSALELENLEEEFPEVAVLRLDCLGLCGLCKLRPYAMVNGSRVSGKTTEECLDQIRLKIQEDLTAYESYE